VEKEAIALAPLSRGVGHSPRPEGQG